MDPSSDCIKLVQSFEGCEKKQPNGTFNAYPDPGTGGDPWTIGWGTTGPDVKRGVNWTQQQCDDRFVQDLNKFAQGVAQAIGGAATTQHQFDALVSFAYNVGIGNLKSSTLLKLHKRVTMLAPQPSLLGGTKLPERSWPASPGGARRKQRSTPVKSVRSSGRVRSPTVREGK